MAADQYVGVAGVARKVKDQYMGVAGVARKVKSGFLGVNGVARRFYAGLNVKPTLADNDWETIAAASKAGVAGTVWSVGDEKDITLTTGETLTLVILDFDHDDLAAGGKAGITFGMKHLMGETHAMNDTSTNIGGFTGSAMYAWLNINVVWSRLPSDLRSVIRSVNKKTSSGNMSATINTDAMNLFLFSEVEVFGKTSYSYAGEGAQYSYFATAANRVKRLKNGAGIANRWVTRSPHHGPDGFCAVDKYGNATVQNAANFNGVCFGFCV